MCSIYLKAIAVSFSLIAIFAAVEHALGA